MGREAEREARPDTPDRMCFLCVDGVQLIDLAGPLDVFDTANRILGFDTYRTEIASVGGGTIRAGSGMKMQTIASAVFDGDLTTLVVTGSFVGADSLTNPEFVSEVRRLAERAERVISICNGAFALAAAEVLDGATATTHWAFSRRLARSYPEVSVRPDLLASRSGRIFTSGGAAAGLDLALAVVAEDHGVDTAREVAKWLVVQPRRPGNQHQFTSPTRFDRTPDDGTGDWAIDHDQACTAGRAAVHAARRAVVDEPARDHRVEDLARVAGYSARHFARLFSAETGTTVARFVEAVRIDAASRLLETSDLDVEAVARRTGFSSAEVMRQVFQRRRSVSPTEHRALFSGTALT